MGREKKMVPLQFLGEYKTILKKKKQNHCTFYK